MSTARFQLRNQTTNGSWSPFDDGDFEAAAGDVIEAKLEDTPALDIWQTVFSCIDRSAERDEPDFDPVDGIAATPTSIVEIALPSAQVGTWETQCQVNGGVAVTDAGGRPDGTVNTKTRMIVVRTANLDLRHPLAGDLAKDPEHAAVALQEMIDAVDAGSGGGGGVFVQSAYAERTTDFVIAPEDPPTWHTVLTVTITTGAGKLQVFASAIVDDAVSDTLSHLARVTVDGVAPAGAKARFVVAGSFTPLNFAFERAVDPGEHTVVFQLQNGNTTSSLEILASSQPDNEYATLLVNEIAS